LSVQTGRAVCLLVNADDVSATALRSDAKIP
jgi:hypothetical protein